MSRPPSDFGTLKYSKAEKSYLKALDYEKPGQAESAAGRVQVFSSLGSVYANEGRYQEAEDAFRRAHQAVESSPKFDPLAVAVLCNNIGSMYGGMGRYRDAETVLRHGGGSRRAPGAGSCSGRSYDGQSRRRPRWSR